jgi:hypothetical protein
MGLRKFFRPQFLTFLCNCGESKDPGPEDPALISPQRGGAYLRLRME